MNYTTLSSIENVPVKRIPTGIPALDKLFGLSDNYAGLPLGGISILAGSAGSGKSRTAIAISSFVNNYDKVLYFQLETNLTAFKSWTNNSIKNPNNYFVSEETNPDKQIEIIRQINPKLVIIDSVNRVDKATNPAAVKGIMDKYIEITKETMCHMMLIGQLGSDKKVRGSLDWTFLPDVVVKLSKSKIDEKIINEYRKKLSSPEKVNFDNHVELQRKEVAKRFIVEIPEKNRYGQTGNWIVLQHEENGVKFISSN